MAVINHLPQAADPPLRDAGDPLPDLILHSRNDTGPPASGPIPAQAEPAARPDLLQLISITYLQKFSQWILRAGGITFLASNLSGFLYFFVVFYQVEDSVIIFTIKKIIQIFFYILTLFILSMFILMLCILTFLTLTWFNFITGILFTEQYISCISFFLPSRPKRCKYKVNYKCVIIFVGAFFTNYLYSMA